jgi:hypothetical protein
MPPSGIEIGFLLDRQWYCMQRDAMDRSKRPTLLLLARVLADTSTDYAIIGGVALQAHLREPRTTLDIDVAVPNRAAIPQEALRAHGFVHTGSFAHSSNWTGPDGTPVQFADDPALAPAIGRAASISLEGESLRVLQPVDLLHEKLRAGADPARRRSKRTQDLADAQALLELDPTLAAALSPTERQLLDKLP